MAEPPENEHSTPPENSRPPAEPRRIAPGDLLAGKYRVEKVLGEGGMGQVLEAVHEGLDQRVAVKALWPRMATQEDAVARFTREAKGLAKLNSEHVARVIDVGKVEGGPPYMVMELLEGKDLGELMDARGALPIAEAAELALHACAGLAAVHAAGIIHRDLKPSNCYVITRADGTACLKLLDFGISKFRGTAVTRTAAIMGSPGYMSPEQMASTKDVDERADIFALGATLYEMLTGRPAFVAENAPMLCIKIANDEPDPPRAARADLPEALEAAILKCLAKDPEARFRTVGDVARAIAPFAPPRAQGYVEKIDGTLRSARVAPASDRPPPLTTPPKASPTPSVFARATVRDGGAAERARGSADAALAKTELSLAVAAPPSGSRRRLLLGAFALVAGVAAALALLWHPAMTASATATPTVSTPASASATNPGSTGATAGGVDAAADAGLDAGADAALDAGDDDDDDDDDAGPAVDAAAVHPRATTHPKPKPKPRPGPKRPRHK